MCSVLPVTLSYTFVPVHFLTTTPTFKNLFFKRYVTSSCNNCGIIFLHPHHTQVRHSSLTRTGSLRRNRHRRHKSVSLVSVVSMFSLFIFLGLLLPLRPNYTNLYYAVSLRMSLVSRKACLHWLPCWYRPITCFVILLLVTFVFNIMEGCCKRWNFWPKLKRTSGWMIQVSMRNYSREVVRKSVVKSPQK